MSELREECDRCLNNQKCIGGAFQDGRINNMCKYCREKGKRENILEDEQLTLKIKKDRVLGFSIRAELEKCIISTKINYCPKCRKKVR